MKKYLQSSNPWIRVALVGLVLIIAFSVIDLYGTSEVSESPRIHIAATIFPVYDLVRSVGGDKVDVQLLLPEGEGPESLPNLYNGIDLSATQAVFAIGQGYDTVGIAAQDASKLSTLDPGIDILLEQGSTGSPNYWLSVKNAHKMAQTIADRLASIDPGSRAYYFKRLDQSLAQLDALDKQIRDLFSQVPKKQLVVYGYDWAYFAKEYGFDIVAFEPAGLLDAEQVDELRQAANHFGETAIFTDIRLSPEAFLPAMAQQYLALFHLDLYGGVEDRRSYASTMAYNAKMIYAGLTTAP